MIARSRRWTAGAVGVVLFGTLSMTPAGGTSPNPPIAGTALARDIDAVLQDARLNGAQVGVVVRREGDGAVLYDRDGDRRLLPASTAKLLTSAAALEVLGAAYRFSTDVVADGVRHGAALSGNVYLRGTGDPTLRSSELDAMAATLASNGVAEISGTLVADDTAFDQTPLGAGWMWDDEPYYYAAPVSALTLSPDADFDAGSVLVRATPAAAAGRPASIQLDPASDTLRVVGEVGTSDKGLPPNLTVLREHGTSTVLVTGSVPAGGPAIEDLSSVDDPTALTADVFRTALARHGIRVRGGATVRGATPAGGRLLASRRSIPLGELLTPFLKLSNNEHAEILTKAMGRAVSAPGTWNTGLTVVHERLAGLGVAASALRMVDGSGLSTMDAVPPDELTKLLIAARHKAWFPQWYTALPVAGIPERMVGGTLRNRMAGTAAAGNLHGKTGSMTGVDALSGYVTAADGERLVFSLVFNGFLGEGPRDLEDAIAVRLANYRGAADTAQSRQAGAAPNVVTPNAGPTPKVGAVPTVQSARNLECSWVRTC